MHKEIVSQIKNLPWSQFDPKAIVYFSWCSAVEFAESLRCALKVYPEDTNLREMAYGELKTNNLSFEDYNQRGDHSEFLLHFCRKYGIHYDSFENTFRNAKKKYLQNVRMFSDADRAMTVFSREHELPNIFEEILIAHKWRALVFGFYEYYLERHIELDSEEGGHANLVANFETDDEVLLRFYKARLELYQSLG